MRGRCGAQGLQAVRGMEGRAGGQPAPAQRSQGSHLGAAPAEQEAEWHIPECHVLAPSPAPHPTRSPQHQPGPWFPRAGSLCRDPHNSLTPKSHLLTRPPLLPNGLPQLHLDYLSLKRAVGSDQGPSSQPWSLAKHLVGALPKLNCPQPLGQGLPTPAPGRTGTFQPVSQCSGG